MGKTVLITGATDGIGKATAEYLSAAGHEIIVHSRTSEKGEKIVNEIQQKTGNSAVKYVVADFSKLSDIDKMVAELFRKFKKIDVLINNAGIYRAEKNILPNGMEESFMINYLSHFYLTTKTLPLLKESEQARIINVSSMIHGSNIDFDNLQSENHFSGSSAYSLSKLCNILFTYKLADELKDSQITVNAAHPGVINTKLLIAGWGAIGENAKYAAERFSYLALNEELKSITGKYFINNRQTRSTAISYNNDIQNKLWEVSNNLIERLRENVD